MKKTFKILMCVAAMAVMFIFTGCAENEASIDQGNKDAIETVKGIMSTQGVSLEKLESVEITPEAKEQFDTLNVMTRWDPWPICGTRKARVILVLMNELGVSVEDLK